MTTRAHDQMPDSFRWSYAISKMLPSAFAIETNYGTLYLDDETRAAVENALRPILEQRLEAARKAEGDRS